MVQSVSLKACAGAPVVKGHSHAVTEHKCNARQLPSLTHHLPCWSCVAELQTILFCAGATAGGKTVQQHEKQQQQQHEKVPASQEATSHSHSSIEAGAKMDALLGAELDKGKEFQLANRSPVARTYPTATPPPSNDTKAYDPHASFGLTGGRSPAGKDMGDEDAESLTAKIHVHRGVEEDSSSSSGMSDIEQLRSNNFDDLSDSKYEALESDNFQVCPPPPLPLPFLSSFSFPPGNLPAHLKQDMVAIVHGRASRSRLGHAQQRAAAQQPLC